MGLVGWLDSKRCRAGPEPSVPAARESLGEDEREPCDGNEWQIFTDPRGWEPRFRRFSELENQAVSPSVGSRRPAVQ